MLFSPEKVRLTFLSCNFNQKFRFWLLVSVVLGFAAGCDDGVKISSNQDESEGSSNITSGELEGVDSNREPDTGSESEGGEEASVELDPLTVVFTASRELITEGESALISWSSSTAERVSITPDIGDVDVSGEQPVSPTITTKYTLTATRDDEQITENIDLTVRPLAAVSLLASAVEGVAPLTVRFTPDVDTSTAINRYYWDFEGDGGSVDGGLGVDANGFDNLYGLGDQGGLYNVNGSVKTYTFDEPGIYTTRIRVWDVSDNQAEASVTITVNNAPPSAFVSVTPTTAQVPLEATFIVSADDSDGIASYEWDFNGDGIYDETTTSGSLSHLYEVSGEFRPEIRVTDTLGASTVLNPDHLQVNAALESVPLVQVQQTPTIGTAPLSVSMDATVTSSSSVTTWAWDFDGDGAVDSNEEGDVSFTYNEIGTFYPTLTITAEDGSVGNYIFSVRVDADFSLIIENASINPNEGDTASMIVTLNGTSEIELVIEDDSGTVRTLSPYAETTSGEYTFTWDGTDDAGTTLAPGPYHALLRSRQDGIEEVLDLRNSSGGELFYPNGWGSGGCRYTETPECGVLAVSANEIEPYADKPLIYDFTTPYNALMTAYVTVIGSTNYAPATFFSSRAMGTGSYSIEWFGEGTNGKLLPVRQSYGYLPAIYGTTASDNAIYLTHGATVDSLQAEPPVFYPSLTSANAKKSTLTFDLNQDADILMIVDSADSGAEVYRGEYTNIPAGNRKTIEWDGRNSEGQLLAPGGYRISLIAYDDYGQTSLPARAMQRIRY